jgi:hypothetical protein
LAVAALLAPLLVVLAQMAARATTLYSALLPAQAADLVAEEQPRLPFPAVLVVLAAVGVALAVKSIPVALETHLARLQPKAATAVTQAILHQTMVVAEAAGRLLLAQMELAQLAATAVLVLPLVFLAAA